MSHIYTAKLRKYIFIAGALLLSIPVHEIGHYIVAKTDGAQIHKFNYMFGLNGTRFINPSITVNEFTFSSLDALILFYLGGFFITFTPGLVVATVLYFMRSNYWKYPYMWVVSAPLVSLSDIERILELLFPSYIAKWIYVWVGVITMIMLGFMRGTKFDVHGTKSL